MGMPDGRSIAAADALATNPNSNQFLNQTLETFIDKNHLHAEFAPVKAALAETSRLVRVRYSYIESISDKAFRGLATEADLANLKMGTVNFIDASVIENLNKLEKQHNQIAEVVMPYYIDENSTLLRGFMIDGEPA